MDPTYNVLIVGGGHAGAQAAIALRQQKFEGTIAIVGAEPEAPYERPPLSKQYMAGEKPFERMLIRPEHFWVERDIQLLTGRLVVEVDAQARRVVTDSGEAIGYDTLIWATGGSPRPLVCAGADLIGVHNIRSRADVDALLTELPAVKRAVVIGGGYIGLEAAAILTKLGKHVTLLEALPRVLARVCGESLSRFYEAEHLAHGVDLRTDVAVDCILGEDGRTTGVRLADGHVLEAEMVIVGIGILPAVEPLQAAGAVGANGVEVNEYCRTSLPNVFAIGDCAAHVNRYAHGQRVRLESVQNANDMAITAARAITGEEAPYEALPWFWSDQYDLRLQTVGLSLDHDQALVRGDPASRSFSVIYLKNDVVIALDCVNAAKDFAQGRALVVDRRSISPDHLVDPSISLKDAAQL